MKKILLLLVCLLILNLVACAKPAPETTNTTPEETTGSNEEPDVVSEENTPSVSGGILTLAVFKNTQFFQQHNCIEAGSWDLRNGNTNYSFDVDIHMLEVEVESGNEKVVGIGLMFFDRRTLTESDFTLIADLLNSLHEMGNHDETNAFIRENIENRLSQIKEAESIDDGILRIWVGKVGAEQVISIELLE